MNLIGKTRETTTYPDGTPVPNFTNSPGVWNLNEVYQRTNGTQISTDFQKATAWPQNSNITLTYRANTTGFGTNTALTLVHPVGVTTGDLCVLVHAAYDTDSDVLINGPSGFSVVQPWLGRQITGTQYMSSCISYSVLSSTANVTLPLTYDRDWTSLATSAPGNQAYVAFYFYASSSINHIRRLPSFEFTRSSATDVSSITNRAGSYPQACPLLALGSVISNSPTNLGLAASDPDFDLVVTNTSATNIEMSVGYKIYNSAPSNIVVDSDSTTSNQALQSILLSIRSL